MDRSLDEVISDRQRGSNNGRRERRRNPGPRDGIRKASSLPLRLRPSQLLPDRPRTDHPYVNTGFVTSFLALLYPPRLLSCRSIAPLRRRHHVGETLVPLEACPSYHGTSADLVPSSLPPVQSTSRDNHRSIDTDWLHDKFDDDHDGKLCYAHPSRIVADLELSIAPVSANTAQRAARSAGATVRIENLHYDLTEDDLEDLFNTIASLRKRPSIRYDRAGRSTGVATVILPTLAAAKEAIREFDGANAHGQPIRLTLVASVGTAATSYTTTGRPNPFEMAQKPSRSLFERISAPPSHTPGDVDDPSDGSASPDRIRARRADVLTKPVPEGIDRYVPGGRAPRRDIRGEHETGRSGGRRPGARRDHDGRDGGRKERGGRADGGDGRGGRRNGRPKKTQEELDAEMEDYWGGNAGPQNGQTGTATAEATVDGDVDMIE